MGYSRSTSSSFARSRSKGLKTLYNRLNRYKSTPGPGG